jgi:hypothetical protein
MKTYSEMTPAERLALRIAQNRAIDAKIAEKGHVVNKHANKIAESKPATKAEVGSKSAPVMGIRRLGRG